MILVKKLGWGTNNHLGYKALENGLFINFV